MTDKHKHTNALIHSASPYLKQHAHNPVNWQPWSNDVWERANAENRLVIVSIGYSTCHWCHVMEKECFEDEPTADIMNKYFLSVKVDREERPDVDMIYMDSCQLMTGRGGWPLNVICMPDKRPVFAGTYFPKESWQNILQQLSDMWENDKPKMLDYAQKIQDGLVKMNLLEFPAREKFSRADLKKTADALVQSFDLQHGGLDRSQKFPMPVVYEYLLDEYLITSNKHLLDFVNFTLLKMANGGIFDHLRGGFYRYATDRMWFAPHFEKMLYDNAQLISLFSRAYAITGAELYKNVALQTIDFVHRELKRPEGGYYSALDADSEGIEGRFYVFTWDEITNALNADELEIAIVLFNLKENGNWEHNFNILHKPLSPLQVIEKLQTDVHTFQKMYISIQKKLFALQETRIRPGLDNKVICSWNALMLKALADAGNYLHEPSLTVQGEALANWMLENMTTPQGLLRVHSSTDHRVNAFSEDYACFVQGLLALFEADENKKWLDHAAKFCDILYADFYDHETQLFVYTPIKEDALLLHKTDTSDDVIPSGNSILSIALQKIGVLMNRMDMLETGKSMLKPIRSQVSMNAPWYSNWCRTAQMEAIGLVQVIVIGKFGETEINEIKKRIPSWAVFATEKSENIPILEHKTSASNKIFICLDDHCLEPVDSVEKALEILEDILQN